MKIQTENHKNTQKAPQNRKNSWCEIKWKNICFVNVKLLAVTIRKNEKKCLFSCQTNWPPFSVQSWFIYFLEYSTFL